MKRCGELTNDQPKHQRDRLQESARGGRETKLEVATAAASNIACQTKRVCKCECVRVGEGHRQSTRQKRVLSYAKAREGDKAS